MCIWSKKERLKHHELNLLTVMCTTHGEGRLINIQCHKECVESKLDISCRMMHDWINIYHVFMSDEHYNLLNTEGQTRSVIVPTLLRKLQE